MKTYKKLYQEVCTIKNIEFAWRKARKRKTLKRYVIDFEKNIKENLAMLRTELLLHSYRPLPLNCFILRDPKTRKISVSSFRDRIVHHAICNIIECLFDQNFIFDNYANRKNKGTLVAIKRLEKFIKKVSKNGTIVKNSNNNIRGFFLKGDIKKYFDTVNHQKMLEIIQKKIKDKELLFLINNVLKNYNNRKNGTGMPLGNLTSQFFANIYLNELDQYVKHKLKAKYYLRYVDDFVILHNDKNMLEYYKKEISKFLQNKLLIELNIDKSKIKPLTRGIEFLGLRTVYKYKLLRKRNIRKAYKKLNVLKKSYNAKNIDYDKVYEAFQGWMAYARNANTFKLRKKISCLINANCPNEISSIEINRIIKIVNSGKKKKK